MCAAVFLLGECSLFYIWSSKGAMPSLRLCGMYRSDHA